MDIIGDLFCGPFGQTAAPGSRALDPVVELRGWNNLFYIQYLAQEVRKRSSPQSWLVGGRVGAGLQEASQL